MSHSEPKARKQRVDQIMADRGLADSRAKAQAYIMAGLVTVAGRKIDKPGHKIESDALIELKGKLAWKLRQDGRVVVHEQTSARILTEQHIPEKVDIIVCDASFISLVKVLERPLQFAKAEATLVALVKPQFEAERSDVGKGGVVRDQSVREAACDKVKDWLIASGWNILGIAESPITGPKGNVEFLIGARSGTDHS